MDSKVAIVAGRVDYSSAEFSELMSTWPRIVDAYRSSVALFGESPNLEYATTLVHRFELNRLEAELPPVVTLNNGWPLNQKRRLAPVEVDTRQLPTLITFARDVSHMPVAPSPTKQDKVTPTAAAVVASSKAQSHPGYYTISYGGGGLAAAAVSTTGQETPMDSVDDVDNEDSISTRAIAGMCC